MEQIISYFPRLTATQLVLFKKLQPVYSQWNAKINVISRKDFSKFYERHVLHSLGIAKFVSFTPGTAILDVGTGGGFPGIPLAILFPEVQFHLVDSIGKKINVVNAVADHLGLSNVKAEQIRAENLKGKYDFAVSRAVTRLPEFVKWIRKNISAKQRNAIPNGILYLKGGDLTNEVQPFRKNIFIQDLAEYFEEEFFKTKKVLYLPL